MANIVVCADGTWNRPEEDIEKEQATNVLKLARAIRPDPPNRRQHVFYDWGLGSYHDRVVAGATGRGIHKNIVDGYRYIVQNYTPDDRIYLLGFSRGAYTVRALCGLINNCGIVRRPHARRIEEAWRTYKRTSSPYHPDGEKAVAFRTDYSHESRRVEFIGVWDTVGALGIPFSVLGFLDGKDEFYDTKMARTSGWPDTPWPSTSEERISSPPCGDRGTAWTSSRCGSAACTAMSAEGTVPAGRTGRRSRTSRWPGCWTKQPARAWNSSRTCATASPTASPLRSTGPAGTSTEPGEPSTGRCPTRKYRRGSTRASGAAGRRTPGIDRGS